MSGFRQPGLNKELITTTGTTLTIGPGDAGKVFSNLGGGGNIAYTIGAAATFRPGDQITILSAAAGTVTVSFTAGELITFNDVAANSIAISTSSEILGGGLILTCLSDAKWHCMICCEETQTVTIAT
jgi:hypothetical protein